VLESGMQGEGAQVFQLQERKEEHTVQQPTILLAILSKMAQKPEIQFEKLFQKLYNIELWLLAYQQIAPKPGNMTAGVDGKTIDKAGLKLITDLIADLKASRYNCIGANQDRHDGNAVVGGGRYQRFFRSYES
jgi:hypothetical protein